MPHLLDGDDRIVLPAKLTAREKALIRGFRYYHFRAHIAYSQSRPTQLRLPKETTRLDCSGLVAACMDFTGAMPKVDWRWTNTDVQIHFGKKVTRSAARPADVVFYGQGTDPSHEALLLGSLAELKKLVEVPDEIASEMTGKGDYVLSFGHFPMIVAEVDYRPDRIMIRSFLP